MYRTNLKKLMVYFLVMTFLAGAAGCSSGPGKGAGEPKARPEAKSAPKDNKKTEFFTDVAWLKNNLNSIIILDARKDKEYKAGHIPGAINAPWQGFARMEGNPGDPGWGTLLPKDKLAEKLGAIGINADKDIVIYADPNGWGEDGRILWMLKMAGLNRGKLLDGGWPAWKAAGGETGTEAPVIKPVKLQIPVLDENMTATTEWIKTNLNRIRIVDARAQKEFQGAVDFGEKRGGHLPDAVNIPFKEVLNDDGTVKSVPELKELFAKAGLKPEDEIVVYCTKGIRSAHMTLLLRLAGFAKARNYDASFYEWAGNELLPVAK